MGVIRNKKKIHDLESGITPSEIGGLSVINLTEDDVGQLQVGGYFEIDLNEFDISIDELRIVTWSLATSEGDMWDVGGYHVYENEWVYDGIRISNGFISSLYGRIAVTDIVDTADTIPTIGDRNISMNTVDNKLYIGGSINRCGISLFYEKNN